MQKELTLGEESKETGSPALLAAQIKLQLLREQHQARRQGANSQPVQSGRSHFSSSDSKINSRQLPDHLGWGSAPLTAAIRAAQTQGSKNKTNQQGSDLSGPGTIIYSESSSLQSQLSTKGDRGRYVKLYPDVGLGMIRQGQEAAGRIWLLLQYMDETGCGQISLDEARCRLTIQGSALRVCGRRQLRKLLARGEDVFWQRNNGRIWLRSTTKVAASLSVHRLTGQPVALSIEALLQGIGAVRAHFYASFHSGRSDQTSKRALASPISRASLKELCHVSARTQRRYEKQTAVRQQSNFAIGQPSTQDEMQEQAWKYGRAVFRFVDYAAKLGQKGISYTAWQLPNNYFGPHHRQPKGRQKRMNRELADLFTKGMTGNGKDLVQEQQTGDDRRFYNQGQSAAASYNRSPNQDLYWRGRFGRPDHYQLWHVLPAKETG